MHGRNAGESRTRARKPLPVNNLPCMSNANAPHLTSLPWAAWVTAAV
jgi:hypothetical protein